MLPVKWKVPRAFESLIPMTLTRASALDMVRDLQHPPNPQIYNVMTLIIACFAFGTIKINSENSEKRVDFFQKPEKRGTFMTLYLEVWDEVEKSGTVLDTQSFIGNGDPDRCDC